MEGVHLGSDLIDEALEEVVDGVSDWLTVINDGVDEFEEVVRKRTVGRLVGVEEEVRDIYA